MYFQIIAKKIKYLDYLLQTLLEGLDGIYSTSLNSLLITLLDKQLTKNHMLKYEYLSSKCVKISPTTL